jgi:hypothetical protein
MKAKRTTIRPAQGVKGLARAVVDDPQGRPICDGSRNRAFSVAECRYTAPSRSGAGGYGGSQRPMPPGPGRWVLAHRDREGGHRVDPRTRPARAGDRQARVHGCCARRDRPTSDLTSTRIKQKGPAVWRGLSVTGVRGLRRVTREVYACTWTVPGRSRNLGRVFPQVRANHRSAPGRRGAVADKEATRHRRRPHGRPGHENAQERSGVPGRPGRRGTSRRTAPAAGDGVGRRAGADELDDGGAGGGPAPLRGRWHQPTSQTPAGSRR